MKLASLLVLLVMIPLVKMYPESFQEKSAVEHVKKFIAANNTGDYKIFTDYLLPSYYGNNPQFKEDYMNMWKKIFEKKRDPIEYTSLLKLGKFGKDWQVMFQVECHKQAWVIYGISSDDAKTWLFSQLYNKPGNFARVLEDIPTFDLSFAPLLDPRYGQRITYKTGEKIVSFNYTDINGVVLNSEELKGKVIVLNFWSPSCGPCRTEMPELNKLVEKMTGKDVVFIAPAIYVTKEQLLNPEYMRKYPFAYHQVVINHDDYDVMSFPRHIIIDKNQTVVWQFDGYTPTTVKTIEDTINGLLR